ncbi:MAG TPA: hypothetical protein VMG30_07860 [Acidobacteriota bacterium]|nr:hypothetical protein [Acidobacteriota bacterium]
MSIPERQATTPSRKQVGYFCHLRIGEKHMGGILITNPIGVPLEFKYTDPVVATRLHKILYGSVLEKYLHETVIRERLAREVRGMPDYFITNYDEKEFLGPVTDREMVAVQKCSFPPEEITGAFTRIREREAIIQLEDEAVFLRLAFSTPDETMQRSFAAWLTEIARTMDVLEPLDRITTALTSICGEGKN